MQLTTLNAPHLNKVSPLLSGQLIALFQDYLETLKKLQAAESGFVIQAGELKDPLTKHVVSRKVLKHRVNTIYFVSHTLTRLLRALNQSSSSLEFEVSKLSLDEKSELGLFLYDKMILKTLQL